MNTNLLFKWFKRETAFFWLGMLMLPVFWVWWTLLPRFKPWERALALKWTAVWVAFVILRWQDLPGMYVAARNAFPDYCAMAAFWLWALFLIRAMGLMVVILIDIIPVLTSLSTHAVQIRGYYPFEPLLWVAIPLALNFLLNPVRRGWRKLERISITLTIPPRLIRR